MNATEKLRLQKEMLEPVAREWLREISGGGPVQAMAAAMMTPLVEAWIDDYVGRPAEVLDAELAGIIDFVGRLRSDDARAVVALPDGARWLDPAAYELVPAGDRLRGPDLRDRQDAVGEVAAGPDGVPLGGGASADHRPG